MPPSDPLLLTIAGLDPSAGAGIAADLKVFAAHGCYGMAALTALTVQSTRGVRAVRPVEPALLGETLECLAADVDFAGVKIGMLGTEAAVLEVARYLSRRRPPVVVLDPVLESSSGARLLEPGAEAALLSSLLPLVDWVTPNRGELLRLAGGPAEGAAGGVSEAEADPAREEALERLALSFALPAPPGGPRRHGPELVVTGGDARRPDDLVRLSGRLTWLRGEHVETACTHGTGCTFSSALLAELVRAGWRPGEDAAGLRAAQAAKQYVTGALRAARPVGGGRGPLAHFFRGLPGDAAR
jgi:hydroxymethylpyrimidine/phosphomethylpyrimidine kinase